MAASDNLDCFIYVQPDVSIGALAQFVSERVGGNSGPAVGMTVSIAGCDIEVRKNPDHDDVSQTAEDGFLYFRNKIEIYPVEGCQRKNMIELVGKLLTSLWSRGWPAVAACDYEADLPSHGGFGVGSIPWSNSSAAAPLAS